MRFMMLVKATKDFEAGVLPDEKLLSEMGSDGAEFIAAGVETKHLLKNLKDKGERPLRRFIGGPTNECEKRGIITNEGSK